MGVANLKPVSAGLSSVVKSVQRGVAGGAGNITISSVNIAKTQITSFSTSSAGTVSASGVIAGQSGSNSLTWQATAGIQIASGNYYVYGYATYTSPRYAFTNYALAYAPYAGTMGGISLNSTYVTGGTTDLTAAQYGAYLQDATTLVVTGPCRYEIVEYY
jgi:hypothetical protein